jgi:hypothetical protein
LKPVSSTMAAHVERIPFPHRPIDPHPPLRRFLAPALGSALLAALIGLIRRATQQPSLPRMSEQWLASQQQDFYRLDY